MSRKTSTAPGVPRRSSRRFAGENRAAGDSPDIPGADDAERPMVRNVDDTGASQGLSHSDDAWRRTVAAPQRGSSGGGRGSHYGALDDYRAYTPSQQGSDESGGGTGMSHGLWRAVMVLCVTVLIVAPVSVGFLADALFSYSTVYAVVCGSCRRYNIEGIIVGAVVAAVASLGLVAASMRHKTAMKVFAIASLLTALVLLSVSIGMALFNTQVVERLMLREWRASIDMSDRNACMLQNDLVCSGWTTACPVPLPPPGAASPVPECPMYCYRPDSTTAAQPSSSTTLGPPPRTTTVPPSPPTTTVNASTLVSRTACGPVIRSSVDSFATAVSVVAGVLTSIFVVLLVLSSIILWRADDGPSAEGSRDGSRRWEGRPTELADRHMF